MQFGYRSSQDFERLIEDITLEAVEFPPNERLWVEAGQTNQFLKVYSLGWEA
jgi:hypothetical protein